MRLYRAMRRAPDQPATLGDVAAAYVHNLRRTVVLGVLYLVLAGSFFAYTAQQYVSQRQYSHDQCTARNANVVSSDRLYQRLATYWDGDGRAELARLYRSMSLAAPRC